LATIEAYEVAKGRNKRERQRYRVVYRRPDGQQTSKSGFTTKRDAENYVTSVEHSKNRGEYINPADSAATVGELAPAWFAKKAAALKQSSFQPLESAWRNHVEKRWGSVRLRNIQQTSIEQWIAELMTGGERRKALGATSVIRCHGVLYGILRDAVKDRRILRNPAEDVELPKKSPKPKVYLTHEQVRRLALNSERPELVLTLAYTGLRWSEAAGLQVKHLDMLRRRIRVERNINVMGSAIWETTPKSGKARTVPFPAFLSQHLAKLCEGKKREDPVFTEPGGGVLQRSHHKAGWFEHAVKAAGVPRVTPHDLRHSAASFAVAAGGHVKVIQRMLGHASAAMTLDRYADLFDGDLDDVAAALDKVAREAWGAA
jgi:integrase